MCDKACQPGNYGKNCSRACSPNCKTCRHKDILCSCKAGWMGDNCTTECIGSYGENCQYRAVYTASTRLVTDSMETVCVMANMITSGMLRGQIYQLIHCGWLHSLYHSLSTSFSSLLRWWVDGKHSWNRNRQRWINLKFLGRLCPIQNKMIPPILHLTTKSSKYQRMKTTIKLYIRSDFQKCEPVLFIYLNVDCFVGKS